MLGSDGVGLVMGCGWVGVEVGLGLGWSQVPKNIRSKNLGLETICVWKKIESGKNLDLEKDLGLEKRLGLEKI